MRMWLTLVLLCASPALFAQAPYPAKPIRIIILVVPGGGADITSRTVGQKLTEAWGQQVIVDNRPGGNGIVGMEIAARSNPDGYTLVLGTIGPVAVNPSLYKKLPYDPVARLRPGRARGLRAERARRASVGAGEIGEGADRVCESESGQADLRLVRRRLRGPPRRRAFQHARGREDGARALQRRRAGDDRPGRRQSAAHLRDRLDRARQHQGGRIRPLAVTFAKRVEQFPDWPTVAEAGVPGFAVDNWYGFLAPRGTPKPIVSKLHREINRILDLPDVKERLAGLGIFPFVAPTPAAFGDYIKSEIRKYAKVVQDSGVKAD